MEIVMQNASDALHAEHQKARLSTGSGDFDALLDGIKQGQLYLFYSEEPRVLDRLVHRLLINSITPVEQGGFGARALYMNVCNYHQGKTLLNPSTLAMIAKCVGIDPKHAFRQIVMVAAFNEVQQLSAANEVVKHVQQHPGIKLVVIHNLTRFIETSRKPVEAREKLKQVIGILKRVCAERDVALVVTCNAFPSRRRLPKPIGGTFLRHVANVIVLLKNRRHAYGSAIKATLIKHPYKPTPYTITLYAPTAGVTLTGHVTPSFHQRFHQLVDVLKRSGGFRNTLQTLQHRTALDQLLHEVAKEEAAMSNTPIPYILDVVNLMAVVHNMRLVDEIHTKLQILDEVLSHA